MAIVRRNGQLIEETPQQGTLRERVDSLGTEAPTTPGGAAALGASPDAAKMAGTPAQKKPILQEKTRKEETLTGMQRLAGPAEATEQQQEALGRAKQMAQLGTLGSRVQSKIEGLLTAPEIDAGLTVDEQAIATALGIESPESTEGVNKIAAVNTFLQDYLGLVAAGKEADAQALIQQEAAEVGLTAEDVFTISGFYTDGTAKAFAEQTPDQINMLNEEGALDEQLFGGLGFGGESGRKELEDLLGTSLEGMTLEEFQNAVEAAQQEEFSRIEGLRAELASLPSGSARRELLREEMRALGDVGLTGQEKAVAEAVRNVDKAEEVTIGETSYNVKDLLKDETLQGIIADYISADSEERERLLPADEFGELRSWIDENQKIVGDIKYAAGRAARGVETATEDHNALINDSGVAKSVFDALDIYTEGGLLSEASAAAEVEKLSKTGIGQLILESRESGYALPTELLSDLTAAEVSELSDWSRDDIVTSFNLAREATTNPALGELLGGVLGRFASKEQRDAAAGAKTILANIEEADLSFDQLVGTKGFKEFSKRPDASEWIQSDYSNLLTDPDVLELINDGTLDFDNASVLDRYVVVQDEWDEYKREEEAFGKLDKEEYIENVFEGETVVSLRDKAKSWRAKYLIDGDKEALSILEEYTKLLKDPKKYRQGKSLMDFLQGNVPDLISGDRKPADLPGWAHNKSFKKAMSDGAMTEKEFFSLDQRIQKQIIDSGKKFPGVPSPTKYVNTQMPRYLRNAGISQEMMHAAKSDVKTMQDLDEKVSAWQALLGDSTVEVAAKNAMQKARNQIMDRLNEYLKKKEAEQKEQERIAAAEEAAAWKKSKKVADEENAYYVRTYGNNYENNAHWQIRESPSAEYKAHYG